ncbi:MAG: response regulator transcription factor [Clostridia bacterium]|nr:response regulator transcription factor [Clostridia bacterium]
MLVAICDDEPLFCEQLKNAIYNYSNKYNLDTVIEIFYNGSQLLKNDKFDIIFLDYQMPGLDGLQTAHALRKNNHQCTIIFLTSFPEIVYDTFQFETFRFLIKPLDTTKLHEALDSYRKRIETYYPISVTIDCETIKINTKDIIYVEANGKNSIIRLLNDSIHCPKTLAKVFSLLPTNCFYKPHRSFVVNFLYIDSYTKNSIRFINGEYAKISRDQYKQFKKALNIFLNDNAI